MKKLYNHRSISAHISRVPLLTATNDRMTQTPNMQSYHAFSIQLCWLLMAEKKIHLYVHLLTALELTGNQAPYDVPSQLHEENASPCDGLL